jgi:hypothetical protein
MQLGLADLSSQCVCESPFSMEHSQICHTGGFINMRHDAVRNILAGEMSDPDKKTTSKICGFSAAPWGLLIKYAFSMWSSPFGYKTGKNII